MMGCSIYRDDDGTGKRTPMKNVAYLQSDQKSSDQDTSVPDVDQEYYDFNKYNEPVHYYQPPKEMFADKKATSHKPKKVHGTKLYKKMVKIVPVEDSANKIVNAPNKQNIPSVSKSMASNPPASAPETVQAPKTGLVRIVRKQDGTITSGPVQPAVPAQQNVSVAQPVQNSAPMVNSIQPNAPIMNPTQPSLAQPAISSVPANNQNSSENKVVTKYEMNPGVTPDKPSKSYIDEIADLFERKSKKTPQSVDKKYQGSKTNNQNEPQSGAPVNNQGMESYNTNSDASGTYEPENKPIPLPFN